MPVDYLWLIYKRGKRKSGEQVAFKECTPEVSPLGLANILSFTTPVRLTSKFLIAWTSKRMQTTLSPQRGSRNKAG